MADREGYFTSFGKTLDESMGMMNDFRSGKLTRAQFDRWYEKKRKDGMDMVFKLRDRSAGLRQPVELVFEVGKGFVTGPTSPPYRRHSRRRGSAAGMTRARHGATAAVRGASAAAQGAASAASSAAGGRGRRRSVRRGARR